MTRSFRDVHLREHFADETLDRLGRYADPPQVVESIDRGSGGRIGSDDDLVVAFAGFEHSGPRAVRVVSVMSPTERARREILRCGVVRIEFPRV